MCRRTVARHVHKRVHHHRQLVLHRRQVHRIHAGRDFRSIDPAVCVGVLFDTASRRRASYPQLSHNSANRTGQAQDETERPPERQAPWPSPFVALHVLQDAVPRVPPPRPHAVSRERGSRCQDAVLPRPCGARGPVSYRKPYGLSAETRSVPCLPTRHPLQAEWRTRSWVTHCLTTSSS